MYVCKYVTGKVSYNWRATDDERRWTLYDKTLEIVERNKNGKQVVEKERGREAKRQTRVEVRAVTGHAGRFELEWHPHSPLPQFVFGKRP